MAARPQRPDDVVDARWIDVVVDDDGEAVLIAAGKTLRSNDAGLLHMAGVTLLDRDDGKLSWTRLVGPDAADFRHTGFFQFLPNMRRARDRAQQRECVRRARRVGAGEDRIVAMQNTLHADERFQASRAGVVAGPFAEGAF